MPEPPGKKPRQRRKRPLQPSMGSPPASPATDPDVQVPALPSSDVPCPIVGIGASAGGLEAFTQLLEHLPAETGLAFVLVQHLDPTHKSLLTELLSRVSRIPVQQVQDGMAVEANRLYVVPPNVNMTIPSAAQLFQAYAASGNIGLDMQVDEVFVTIDTAIPCGLILNELITNVLQHAFPAGRTGELSITLRAEPEGRVLLVVQDNGVGMPGDVDIAHTDSLGLSLVHGLVHQIGGSLQIDRSTGTAISLRFSASLPRAM